MADNGKTRDFGDEIDFLSAVSSKRSSEVQSEEDSCAAFGFLRGHDRALAIEFRLRTGDSEWLSYQILNSWRFNPSVGVLMKFTGDAITLVVLRGSNLDLMLPGKDINLTDRGLQRHKITFIREMDEAELRRAGKAEPTIDKIDIVECQTLEEQQEWITKHAGAFARA